MREKTRDDITSETAYIQQKLIRETSLKQSEENPVLLSWEEEQGVHTGAQVKVDTTADR